MYRGVRKYAIVDIETTGGLYNRDKIIEIAIIVTDGTKILEDYQTLIDPERSIPYTITRITGIDDELVSGAPKFYEIAKHIVQLTESCIFVAHNVQFDYGFIKEEFRSLGFPYNRKRLCTVKLTRSLIPGLRSYGLDNLIKHFGLKVDHRHRAYGDTYATYQIFTELYQGLTDNFHLDHMINEGIDATILPQGMEMEEAHNLPETPGVYYLSNVHKRIIYIGKAKNIKSRLFQHFRQLSRKSINIHNQVHHVHFNETGHELIALLLELYEIKVNQPELNKSLRRNSFPFALYYDPSASGERPCLLILKNNNKNDRRYVKYKLFGSKLSADSFLQGFIDKNEICSRYCKTRQRTFNCYCDGECQSFFDHPKTSIIEYLEEVKNEFDNDFVLILNGRIPKEKSFVMIHQKKFWGIGYIPESETIVHREEWNDYISYQFFYPEANGIIKNFISKHKVTKIELH